MKKFSVILVLFLTACGSLPDVTEIQNSENDFVCLEAKASTLFSMFSGATSYRRMSFPDNVEMSKDDMMEIAARCFTTSEYGFLLDALRAQ